ncbi:MAG: hydratase [Clostridia bacterium]|nr:hydratase [Clostridia bacterium]
MVWLNGPVLLKDGKVAAGKGEPGKGTMSSRILEAHGGTNIRFDALISHDITYVGIIQTARASGMRAFPLPYAFTNCHNSLCAVGGTINEDDHAFGLSAARKYGGIYVPRNLAVIHQYAREQMASCGGMILGSDSHTRYGALGTMGVGEGGPELVKQLLGNTYDFSSRPGVVLVYLTGKPRHGVGPHDVALALCAKVYKDGLFKNRILEFAGPGVGDLSMDFRIGIDVMTTETACLSSIWVTDDKTRGWYKTHGREYRFSVMAPDEGACYDAALLVELDSIEPMIALPFHPSNAFTIRQLNETPLDVLREAEKVAGLDGELVSRWTDKGLAADQYVIAGCAGGMYENLLNAAAILRGRSAGDMNIYPASVPQELALLRSGATADLLASGAVMKPCFCGPCFGAGDTPKNGGLSLRHTTRNFPFREGAKPGEGQKAFVALMDARSIAASAAAGRITGADTLEYEDVSDAPYSFDPSPYLRRVEDYTCRPETGAPLAFGPNIADWPEFPPLGEDLSFTVASVLTDPVTTTDELIPSGETSSYRSNPARLAEFALSRRDPGYAARSKQVRDAGGFSCVCAVCPGDGSAREQAASCQRVLGGAANIAVSYATKRYRSNLVNWGIFPFVSPDAVSLKVGDTVTVKGIKAALLGGRREFAASVNGGESSIGLALPGLTDDELQILLDGCLINHYRRGMKHNG